MIAEGILKLARKTRAAALGDVDPAAALREESPLRAEIFGIEQLEVHAKVIAGWHKMAPIARRDRLLSRLAENEEVLLDAFEQVSDIASKGQAVSPGGEWLIDNFYLIEEQIRTARRHLPQTYSKQLPQLRNGPAAGLPRVYHIALELIAHLDGRIDIESVTKFIASYQVIHPLRIGELWAVPIMFRLALLENTRRIAARIALGLRDRVLAEAWALRLIETAEQEPARLILILADMARSNPFLSTAFVAEFSRQIQGKSPSLGISLSWIDQRLAEQGQSVEERVHLEAQQQAANQVSMGNSIASLRVLGAIDWRDFVEGLSVVEQTLRRDPAGVYAAMDFATRDRYRHAVENVAKRSACSEEEVARHALDLATQGVKGHSVAGRPAHIGYYLADKGLPMLEMLALARLPTSRHLRRFLCHFPLTFYLGLIVLLTGAFSAGLLALAAAGDVPGWGLAGLVPLVILAMSQLAVALANWMGPLFLSPRMMPRMDYSHGIPPEYPTMVVVPTMLADPAGVTDLLERLEIHYLSNRDDRLYFALLTDFKDAPQKTMPGDAAVLQAASDGIKRLNERYGSEKHQPYFLFHRPRRWCKGEGKWIGYERKRGKLAEFNAVLRGGPGDRFLAIEGDRKVLPSIRFVITLDTDTDLPRGAARKLVATMAHPLVRAQIDARTGLIREGYAILQPRVAVSLPSASRSWFVKLLAGEPGIDPYTRVVSDLYQDLFQEGSFIGKGIYDVDAFEKILGHRFPENRILSHDLLEGCYARAGVVSDIQLYEDHPWRFSADVKRRHRWIRGDWQIASWILPWVPGPAGRRVWNPLSALSRWKILDNLRRSLVAPALLLVLLVAWTALAAPALWTAAVLAVYLAPVILAATVELFGKPLGCTVPVHLRSVWPAVARHLGQVGLALIFLPCEALYSMDAILRTLGRVLITHRRLLEWETANDVQRQEGHTIGSSIRGMLLVPLLAVAALALLMKYRPGDQVAASPFLALWMTSPAIAWLISQPLKRQEARLGGQQRRLLRVVARRTWRFFDTFIGPEDHCLPPDNVQEHPTAVTAHRTSPTNIGLGILSTLAAYDFGYISAGDLIERTNRTLRTMETMNRHHGHFYNWYDTRTLQPLPPLYVSTVDSGNLAGLLMTFRQGILELAAHPIVGARTFEGLGDMVLVLAEQLQRHLRESEDGVDKETRQNIAGEVATMLKETQHAPQSLTASVLLLERLRSRATKIGQLLAAVPDEELRWASEALVRQCQALHEDVILLAPWLQLPPPPANVWTAAEAVPEAQSGLTKVQEEFRKLDTIPTALALAGMQFTLVPMMDALLDQLPKAGMGGSPAISWLMQVRGALADAAERAMQRCTMCESSAAQCESLGQMDFAFLFDTSREQLAIGFNVTNRRRDASFYDLLASESRLGIFAAIAQGWLPQETWFALGRNLTTAGGRTALLSWSGSMFEYLMPLLVMPTYDDTLLDHTYRAVVARQVEYGQERGRALGNVGIGLQHDGRAIELSIPCVWHSGPGV